VKLGKGEEEALAAAIQVTLQEPQKDPLSLPHLSAEVLADQYVNLYRALIPSKAALPIADVAVPARGGAAPERLLYDRISGAESRRRRDERGYI
jgi:hypothetical protein